MIIRRLDPTTDEPLHHIAYYWLVDSPGWRQVCAAVFGTLDHEQYLRNTHDSARVDIGVFNGPEFVALISLILRAPDIYEANLEAAPGTSPALIISAGQQVVHQMFSDYGMKLGYTLTPIFNRSALKINKAIGFRPDNVIIARGVYKGRLIDWARYSITNPLEIT